VNGEDSQKPVSSPRKPQLIASCLWLSLALLLAFPLFAWYGFSQHGNTGLLVAAIAGGVCWLGATLALICSAMFRGQQQALNGMLLGMLFRMGLPLGTGVILSQQVGFLAEAGIFGTILVYYLLALVVETLLSLRHVEQAKQALPEHTSPSQASPSQASKVS